MHTGQPSVPVTESAAPVAVPLAAAEDARERLLTAGIRLFAQQGFARTSTRELAEAAQVNVAAISYYFGDKAGLYRAAFFAPCGTPEVDVAAIVDPQLSLPQVLRGFYDLFLEPLTHGEQLRLCMKLRFREMLEPTGLWDEEVALGIAPMHHALVQRLCQHLGLAQPDDDVQRLAVALAGLGVHMHVGRDITDRVAPGLMDGPGAITTWADRLQCYALGMVQAEIERRGDAGRDAGRDPGLDPGCDAGRTSSSSAPSAPPVPTAKA